VRSRVPLIPLARPESQTVGTAMRRFSALIDRRVAGGFQLRFAKAICHFILSLFVGLRQPPHTSRDATQIGRAPT
jgi:hypothetical protein